MSEEPLIAVFVDFENLAIGSRDVERGEFRIDLALKRLLEKGRIVFKRAYCDWGRYRSAVREFHSHGVQLVDIPLSKMSGKNSADIHMVVDALDLCYAKQHIDIFALLSGDSDFSPLVSKLKENNKRVIGCGVKSSTSSLLIASCDEFIYYDDLIRADAAPRPRRRGRAGAASPSSTGAGAAASGGGASAQGASSPSPSPVPAATATATPSPASGGGGAATPSTAAPTGAAAAAGDAANDGRRLDAITKLVQIVRSLERDYDPVWGSMVKQTMRRVYPGFNEEYVGFPSFVAFLEAARDLDYLDLEYDQRRGNYIVRGVAE